MGVLVLFVLCLVWVLCLCRVFALVLRVFLASLAVDLASLCWSPRTPQVVGPSFLDTGAVAPLTGDRTVVSGKLV